MTVVVADTSPLNYLLLIGSIAVLPELYGNIVVPPEVLAELSDPDAPPEVVRWILKRPNWLHVQETPEAPLDSALLRIDPGERAAILIAQSEPDVLLLIDDAAGRAEANRRGIPTTGTLGILQAGAARQIVDLPVALARLSETNFRMSRGLMASLIRPTP